MSTPAMTDMVTFQFNDGGRAAAGYKGQADDCVTRAIAIAAELPYQQVYDALNQTAGRAVARTGVHATIYRQYLDQLGFRFTPTMSIGSGCKVHLVAHELPAGRIIARCSRHLVAVIHGVVHDTGDPSRDVTRCVYGYWHRAPVVELRQVTE